MTDPNAPPMPPIAAPSSVPEAAQTTAPEAPIGAIADPAAAAPKMVTVPTPDVLAAFPPPPPIAAPVGAPALDPQPLFGVFPTAPVKALPPTAPPQPVGGVALNPEPPAPSPPKRFHELGERTQAEVKAYWMRRHPGEEFPEHDWVEPTGAITELPGGAPLEEELPVVHVDRQPVKVSQKTLDEMNAGKVRLRERSDERAAVLRKQAEMNAAKLATGEASPANMDYVEPK